MIKTLPDSVKLSFVFVSLKRAFTSLFLQIQLMRSLFVVLYVNINFAYFIFPFVDSLFFYLNRYNTVLRPQ